MSGSSFDTSVAAVFGLENCDRPVAESGCSEGAVRSGVSAGGSVTASCFWDCVASSTGREGIGSGRGLGVSTGGGTSGVRVVDTALV